MPMTSLADDVAATVRAIELVDGPVLLAGHSWSLVRRRSHHRSGKRTEGFRPSIRFYFRARQGRVVALALNRKSPAGRRRNPSRCKWVSEVDSYEHRGRP